MEKIPVLLIEDDAFLAKIYTQKLEAEEFDVSLASSGEEGLKLLERGKPACVLLDILLPGIDGFEVLERIKQDPGSSHIPVIMISSLGQREDIERAMGLGASAYLIKTHCVPDDILRKVREILS